MTRHVLLLLAAWSASLSPGRATAQDAPPPRVDLARLHAALVQEGLDADAPASGLAERRERFRFRERNLYEDMMVVVRPASLPGCSARLDAGRALLSLHCAFLPTDAAEPPGIELPAAATSVADKYAARDPYGRPLSVRRAVVEQVSLLVPRSDAAAGIVFDIPAIPVRAGHAREDYQALALGLVFTLRKPYATRFEARQPPTLAQPTDITTRSRAVVGSLSRLHVLRAGEPTRDDGMAGPASAGMQVPDVNAPGVEAPGVETPGVETRQAAEEELPAPLATYDVTTVRTPVGNRLQLLPPGAPRAVVIPDRPIERL